MSEKPPLPELPRINAGFYRHTTTGKLVLVTHVSWDEETLGTDSPRSRVNYQEIPEPKWCPTCGRLMLESQDCQDAFHTGYLTVPPLVYFGRLYEVFTGEIVRDGKPDKRFKYIGPDLHDLQKVR